MVRYLPCPGPRYMFVGSSLPDRRQAAHEVKRWTRAHGFRRSPETPAFFLYPLGQPTQEWHLLERRVH